MVNDVKLDIAFTFPLPTRTTADINRRALLSFLVSSIETYHIIFFSSTMATWFSNHEFIGMCETSH